jgi:hypothetical protein
MVRKWSTVPISLSYITPLGRTVAPAPESTPALTPALHPPDTACAELVATVVVHSQMHVTDVLKMPRGMKRRNFHDDMTVVVVYLPYNALEVMENSSHGSTHRAQRVLDRARHVQL